tara:strand:- start:924 stop:1844 length:921 start_codon:yes stop_codon:yes gene_type:complete
MAPRKKKTGASEPDVVTRLRRGSVSILDAVVTELPDVFYGEILPKLDLNDTLNLAQVSKAYKDTVWSVGGVRSLEEKIGDHVEMLEREDPDAPPGWFVRDPMLCATSEGNAPAVKALLESGYDLNADESNALWTACDAGWPAVVKILIEAGADVNVIDAGGTALSNAAYKGFTVIVAMLLKAGADVNLTYPLHASLASPIEGNETCVFMLIQAGADIDKLDDRGRTPMQIVAGHEEKMKRSWKSLEEKQKADPEFKAFMATRLDYKESYWAVGIDFPLGDYHRKYTRYKELLQNAEALRRAETSAK